MAPPDVRRPVRSADPTASLSDGPETGWVALLDSVVRHHCTSLTCGRLPQKAREGVPATADQEE